MDREISFSVLITVFNCEKYIRECIDSVLAQTYQNFRIIIVDDGSTDLSGQICDAYAVSHENVKVIHQQNMNIVASRGVALKHVDTDYFIYLDSDDYWEVDLLLTLKNEIVRTEADLLIFRLNYVNEHGRFIRSQKSVFANEVIIDEDHTALIFKRMISTSDLNNLVCKAIKSDLIKYYDYSEYFEVEHAEDLLKSLPFIYYSKKIIYIDEALYNYRNVPDSMSHRVSSKFVEDISIVRQRLLDYLKMLKLDSEENLNEFYYYYLKIVANYLPRYVRHVNDTATIVAVCDNIHDIELFHDAYKSIKTKGQQLHQKISLMLLYHKSYKLLIVYERLKVTAREMKRFLTNLL